MPALFRSPLAAAFLALALSSAAAQEPFPSDKTHTAASDLLPGVQATSASSDPGAMAFNLATQAINQKLVPAIWGEAPDWLKRTEFDVQWGDANDWEYSVLTVQPLYQSAENRDTIFMQVSYEHYKLYDIGRDTVNVGLGYRRLLFDNKLLLGVNSFFDYEFGHDHQRGSVGGDAKAGPLDFFTNYYFPISGARIVEDAEERVSEGYDIGLGSQVPFLPWAKIYGRYYVWKNTEAKNIHSAEFSGEFALHPNFTLVAGTRGGVEGDERENYVLLEFRVGNSSRPTLWTKPYSTKIFETRDLREETLDKVRRENRIIVQRRAGGGGSVIIARGT